MKNSIYVLSLAVSLLIPGSGYLLADAVTPIEVLATSEFGAVDVFGDGNFSDVFADDLIDGEGLVDLEDTPDDILDDYHDNDIFWNNGWHSGDFEAGIPGGLDFGDESDEDWISPPPVNAQILEFKLDGLYDLTSAYIWQQNQASLGGESLSVQRGVETLEILVSAQSTGDNFELLGRHELDIEEGLEPAPAQVVSLAELPVLAQRVRFQILTATSQQEFEFVGLGEVRFEGTPAGRAGDFDFDGELTSADLDILSEQVRAGTDIVDFDLNDDGQVSRDDRTVWVEQLRSTWFGDSNLDGEFNSTDFVVVFQSGEYEDGLDGNSTWPTGDWSGDGEFDSTDFVVAFQAGGYEKGLRPEMNAVPEPSVIVLVCIGLIFCSRWARAQYHRL